ncbi:hypothetical protein ES703_14630 [subsurface metagenome]
MQSTYLKPDRLGAITTSQHPIGRKNLPFKYKKNAVWFLCGKCKKRYSLGAFAEDLRIYECSNPSCDYVELYRSLGESSENMKPKAPIEQCSQLTDKNKSKSNGYEIQIQRLNTSFFALLEEIRSWKKIFAAIVIFIPILLAVTIPLASLALRYVLNDEICDVLEKEFKSELQNIKNSNNEIVQNIQSLGLTFEKQLTPELQKLKSLQNRVETNLQEVHSIIENRLKLELQDLKDSQNKIDEDVREIRLKVDQFESTQKNVE